MAGKELSSTLLDLQMELKTVEAGEVISKDLLFTIKLMIAIQLRYLENEQKEESEENSERLKNTLGLTVSDKKLLNEQGEIVFETTGYKRMEFLVYLLNNIEKEIPIETILRDLRWRRTAFNSILFNLTNNLLASELRNVIAIQTVQRKDSTRKKPRTYYKLILQESNDAT